MTNTLKKETRTLATELSYSSFEIAAGIAYADRKARRSHPPVSRVLAETLCVRKNCNTLSCPVSCVAISGNGGGKNVSELFSKKLQKYIEPQKSETYLINTKDVRTDFRSATHRFLQTSVGCQGNPDSFTRSGAAHLHFRLQNTPESCGSERV